MAIYTSFTEFKETVKDWLNRPDLSDSVLTDFVILASGELQRKLNIRNQMTVEIKTISSAEATAQKFFYPSGADGIVSITDSKGRRLKPVTFAEYKLYAENDGGEASVFAGAGNEIYIGPKIAENDVFTIQFKDEDASYVTNLQGTGVVSAYNPLLMGSLMYAYMYFKDDNRVALYREKFEDAIQDMNNQSTRTLGLGRIKDDSITQFGGPLA
jgi:ketosteroid isomerase-like protein